MARAAAKKESSQTTTKKESTSRRGRTTNTTAQKESPSAPSPQPLSRTPSTRWGPSDPRGGAGSAGEPSSVASLLCAAQLPLPAPLCSASWAVEHHKAKVAVVRRVHRELLEAHAVLETPFPRTVSCVTEPVSLTAADQWVASLLCVRACRAWRRIEAVLDQQHTTLHP